MNRGYSLIEVLIAMAVFAIGLLAFMQLQGHLTRSNHDARIRTLASNIAEEHLEMQKRFTQLATDDNPAILAYQDVGDSTTTVTRGGIEFTVTQTASDYYWDAPTGQFTETAPAGIIFSDFKHVDVVVSWTSSEFVQGGASPGTVGTLGSGSVPVSTVVSSRVTGTNHLALLDELAIQSLCVPLVSCPAAIP